jgi:hypothetical protein
MLQVTSFLRTTSSSTRGRFPHHHCSLDNVINLKYVASTPDKIALLAEQHKFFFSILEQTVQTPDGILIIQKHSLTGNATAVYSDLVERYGTSTAAQLAAEELERDLTDFRIDASWTIKPNLVFSYKRGPPNFLIWNLLLSMAFVILRNANGSLALSLPRPSSRWLSLTLILLNDLLLSLKEPPTS